MKIKQVNKVERTAKTGEILTLPNTVDVELTNGIITKMIVNWDINSKDVLSEPGEYNIHGDIHFKQYPDPFIEQRADPYIYKHHDGYYYFTGSYPLYDRIVLRRAKTIEGLIEAEEKVIWVKHLTGILSEHIWAPEIHYIDDKWYIHFAAGDKDDVWEIRPYVLECKENNPLTGEWEEKGPINTDFQSFSLDATTFAHNGKRYLVWAQKVDSDTVSNLYIAEMSNPWTIISPQVLLSTPEYDWEIQGFYVNEGPAMIKRNGKIFISYSASATDDRYSMGLLSTNEENDLLNPSVWHKSPYPVFVSNEDTSEYGPGHNSFTIADDGETDLLVYHARSYKEIQGNPLYDHNRHARIQPLFWNNDGTPYFGVPGYKMDISGVKALAKIKVVEE